MLPIKTTFEDVDKLAKYLRSQVGWVEIDKAKSAIATKHVDARKLDAMKYIGLLERDGNNIKLTGAGQEYADGDESSRADVLRANLRGIPLYYETVEWLHHSSKGDQTKTQIASYWHDHHSGKLDGAAGSALTDAVIFFMRLLDQADVSHFVPAGRGRPESYLQVESEKLASFVNEATPTPPGTSPPVPGPPPPSPPPPPPLSPTGVKVAVSPDIHINLEIHIAADAKPATVEEIFKNMRKYVLSPPDSTDE
jgi:hypothetical protein